MTTLTARDVLHKMLAQSEEMGLPEGVYLQVCDALKQGFGHANKIVEAFDLHIEIKTLDEKKEPLCYLNFDKLIITKDNEEEDNYEWKYKLNYSVGNVEEEIQRDTGDSSVVDNAVEMLVESDWEYITFKTVYTSKVFSRTELKERYHVTTCKDTCKCNNMGGGRYLMSNNFEEELKSCLRARVRRMFDVMTGMDCSF